MRFDKGNPIVTHCLHLKQDTPEGFRSHGWYNALIMRDYLRSHQQDRELYSSIKEQLASDTNITMKLYRTGKEAVLNAIGDRAQQWHLNAHKAKNTNVHETIY